MKPFCVLLFKELTPAAIEDTSVSGPAPSTTHPATQAAHERSTGDEHNEKCKVSVTKSN